MIILISGEGVTDVGTCTTATGVCEGEEFSPGPMAHLVDRLLESTWGYSPLEQQAMRYVSESHLARRGDALPAADRRPARQVTLPGKKRAKETAYFYLNALALARIAQATETTENRSTMAVLFRDADGTRSTVKGLWEKKVESMQGGFARAGYERGVPMIPKPKSEAWLLCALQAKPYLHCQRLENISGNDDSPNSAKKQLDAALATRRKTHADLPDLATDGTIDVTRLSEMPSFHAFQQRLLIVAKAMVEQPD